MNDDQERRPRTWAERSKISHKYIGPSPETQFKRYKDQAPQEIDQEDTVDDLDNNQSSEEDEWSSSTHLAHDWRHADGDGVLSNRRLGEPPSSDLDLDITADFPTTPNPFNPTTKAALLDIARASSTPINTLRWLSENTDADVRKLVASNTNTPSEVLRTLSKDWDGTVRLAVLDNQKVPIDIITELSSDSNPLVSLRACYAIDERRKSMDKSGSPSRAPAPQPTIKDIPNLHVYHRYSQGAKTLPVSSYLTTEAVEFLTIVAQKLTTPPQRLAELAEHPSSEVRAAVAQNGKTPLDILWRLSLDVSPTVKRGLTQNETCPLELLRELLRDGDVAVRQKATEEIAKFERSGDHVVEG
ncbi:MAG: hypothetical protein K2X93_21445 [Candidatus Obscuribacterales bacterium]|nr:hypothetical protein [Candidatus Obscuribacterales bacterium]